MLNKISNKLVTVGFLKLPFSSISPLLEKRANGLQQVNEGLSVCSDKWLPLEASALATLCGQCSLSTQLIKPMKLYANQFVLMAC